MGYIKNLAAMNTNYSLVIAFHFGLSYLGELWGGVIRRLQIIRMVLNTILLLNIERHHDSENTSRSRKLHIITLHPYGI